MNTFELAKDFVASRRYEVLGEDSSDGHLAFRYQMNTIHFWGKYEDEHFFFLTLPNFDEVTEANLAQIEAKCYQITKEIKIAKMYVLGDVVLAAVETCYMSAEDFGFQMQNALRHLVAAKIMYIKQEK